MAFMLGVAEITGLGEKFDELRTLFSAFCFPPRPHSDASPIELQYWEAVRDLFVLDVGQLDGIAQECFEEFGLQYSMMVDDTDTEIWLKDFISRVDAAKTKTAESLEAAFSTSQTALSQEEPATVGEFNRTISYTTTVSGTPPPPFSQPAVSDIAERTSAESPTSSMQRLALTSPTNKRKLDAEERAEKFLDRLTALQPAQPARPRRPYVYGELPFVVDWEVFRVDHFMSLNLDDAGAWQFEQLRPYAHSPRIIWDRLRKRAEETSIADVRSVLMPPETSDRVYESLAGKGWTDGRVHLSLKMVIPGRGAIFYEVQPMKFSSSRRAYRRFGSDRFITITIPKPEYQRHIPEVLKFLSEPLQICGRTYQVFFVRDSKESCAAHYFATHGAGAEWSRNALMQWLISLEKNKNGSAVKLWSRISLSLSSTTPSVVFAPDEIRLVPDIESLTGECMTDGCAKASPAVFREIWRSGVRASKETPTAVQGRIGGAKGVWYLDPRADLRSDEKWIEIRCSQLKYKYDKTAFRMDEMLRTLDICKESHPSFGDTLNYQLIGILAHSGVPTEVFQDLLRQDLHKHLGVVNELLDQPLPLRQWIADLGGIYNIRCNGLEEYNDSATGEKASREPGCITYDSQGVPTMMEENCVKLLEAGFLPTSNRYLNEKLKHVISKACEKVSDKLHISIAKSSTLICIADDLGILEEDEVSIQFGKPFLDEETGRYSSYIEGDVLVARNPALLPTDIQKVRAVFHPGLKHLTDVIVFSTKGSRSKVSLLSGGDYDGDTVWICWDEKLVDPFRPADLRFANQPENFVKDWFYTDLRTAHEVAPDGMMISPDKFINYGLRSSLVESELGTCTVRHRDVVYKHGNFEHPDALTLAHLASNLVDATKNGLQLRYEKYTRFLSGLRVLEPEYLKPKGTRRDGNPTHVMDVLVLRVIPEFQDQVTMQFHQHAPAGRSMPIDPDILAFYNHVKETHPALVERLRGELDAVRHQWTRHAGSMSINRARQMEDLTCSPSKRRRRVLCRTDSREMENLNAEYRDIRVFNDAVGQMDLTLELTSDLIKAAVAYCLVVGERWVPVEPNNFAWSVGGHDALCKIKAAAVMRSGGVPPRLITERMYISLKTNSAFTRAENLR